MFGNVFDFGDVFGSALYLCDVNRLQKKQVLSISNNLLGDVFGSTFYFGNIFGNAFYFGDVYGL